MPEPSPVEQQSRTGTLRLVIYVLSALNLAWWLMFATSRWFDDGIGQITAYMWLQFIGIVIVPPIVTLPALYLAWKGQRLKLALFLAGIPWLFWFANVLAFAIGVAIYGF